MPEIDMEFVERCARRATEECIRDEDEIRGFGIPFDARKEDFPPLSEERRVELRAILDAEIERRKKMGIPY